MPYTLLRELKTIHLLIQTPNTGVDRTLKGLLKTYHARPSVSQFLRPGHVLSTLPAQPNHSPGPLHPFLGPKSLSELTNQSPNKFSSPFPFLNCYRPNKLSPYAPNPFPGSVAPFFLVSSPSPFRRCTHGDGHRHTRMEKSYQGGLAILWKDGLMVNIISYCNIFIIADIIRSHGIPFRFTGLYGEPQVDHRSQF